MSIKKIKENLQYVERSISTLEMIDSDKRYSILADPITDMINLKLNEIKELLDGMRMDGGAGSGNWGHVGVPLQRGGSAPGGGVAFRMGNIHAVKDPKKKFTSKAKIQAEIRKDLNSKDKRLQARAQKRAAATDMERKSVKKLAAKGMYDPNASKNILADKQLSKTANHIPDNAKGTSEGIKALKKGESAQGTPQGTNQLPTPKQGQNPSNSGSQTQPQSGQTQQTPPQQSAPKSTDPTQVTTRPDSNPNYQKAVAIDPNDKAAQKAFYQEAKANGKLHTGDSHSYDNKNIQRLINYMGYDKTKPTVVDAQTFSKLSRGQTVMCRGTGSSPYTADKFRTADYTRMGGIAYGTGIYFGTRSSAYGTDIQMVAKPDAKILSVPSNDRTWTNRDSRGNTQYTKAIIAGYDAVRLQRSSGGESSSDYFLVFNRGAFNVLK